MSLSGWLLDKFTHWLNHETPQQGEPPCDFDRLSREIRPCDVLLVEGRTRVSRIIKNITLSTWTHSAFYVGRPADISDVALREEIDRHYQGDPEAQLIIEPLLGEGALLAPLDKYRTEHLRICRPRGLGEGDAQRVIAYCVKHIGMQYDFRQMVDLARFLLPYGFLPRRWRSTLFRQQVGEQSKMICSTMIAEAFASVHFPVLPVLRRDPAGELRLYKRNTRLYTPSDFDYSPYFEIIKYPLLGGDDLSLYRQLPWDKSGVVCNSSDDCFEQPQVVTKKDLPYDD